MPYSLPLPGELAAKGWKVKIRDKERLAPPHVSILYKTTTWRWDLRARALMDEDPPPREVPKALMELLERNHDVLCAQWDRMYPTTR